MNKTFAFLLLLFIFQFVRAQTKPFRIAFLSDTHIGSPNGGAEEDLRRTVADINAMNDVAFVVVTGDITELGTDKEITLAKQLLDSLHIRYYVIPGNHDTGWSESGGLSFTKIFGYDKFSFEYNGIRFIGCASGPYVRMSDGHVPRDAVNWLDTELKKLSSQQPIIFLNHYPIEKNLDNWYEVTDRLNQKNTLMIMCGHGHANKADNFEGIPGIMGRSNLRAKAEIGGYNLVDIKPDTIYFTERKPGKQTLKTWTKVAIGAARKKSVAVERPDYSINEQYKFIKPKWNYSSGANVISTPLVYNKLAIFGNSQGLVEALSMDDGKRKWSYKTDGPIYSSPAIAGNKVILGSADGNIYCLDANRGKLIWKVTTGAAVLGSPIVNEGVVFIGGSDHQFRAIDASTGKVKWTFGELTGPVVSTPLIVGDKIIFGAWDKNLYALQWRDGKLLWKWNNGSAVINYSPASCIPVAHDGVIYVVAPDRYFTAIDETTGATLWRTTDAVVRESIGISADRKTIYAKTMNDSVVAFAASSEPQKPLWQLNCAYGYDHVHSMLMEKDNQVFFGTRSGVVYAIDPVKQQKLWAYKIDNSMVNTVNVIDKNHILASTMDGKVCLLVVGDGE